MGRPLILAADEIRAGDLEQLGGKAAGLWHIARAGLRVPAWCALPFDTVAARAWHHDAALQDALRLRLEQRGGHLALRSSAEGEDARGASHAGQYHTAFARHYDEVLAGLDAVADSARGARMAIVVQAALAPAIAGVAFSADPSAAWDDEFYVEHIAGHGSRLVDGEATPARSWIALNGRLTRGDDLPAAITVELARGIVVLEDQLDSALDLEWAVADGTLYFLQARPLTALATDPALRPATCHTSWFFDQRFLRPISPFTRSTLVPLVLRASLGEALAMRRHDPAGASAYFYGGQAYVPHAAYRDMLAGAPRWFLSPDLRQIFPSQCACASPRGSASIFGYAWDAFRNVLLNFSEVFLNIPVWHRFRAALPSAIASALDKKNFVEQWNALDQLSITFLRIHRWSLLWADYFHRAYVVLVALVGPARAARALRENMHLPTAVANEALAHARAVNTPEAWKDLVHAFGHRSESLDYATPTWAEQCVDGRVERGDFSAQSTRADDLKSGAARRTPNSARSLLGTLLTPFRRLTEMREEQRFEWERILAAQRGLVLAQARTWAASGALSRADDAWLLNWDEFLAALRGAALPTPSELTVRRHALRVEALVPKPLFLGPELIMHADAHASMLQGVGASAGRAEGDLVLLRDPARGLPLGLAPPFILVVRALDPAHTHLLRAAAGVVAERGGLLSHAAILAREYGVPLVTALEGALDHLPQGARAAIDGQAGTVEILKGEETNRR